MSLQQKLLELTLAQECEEARLEAHRAELAQALESNRQRVDLLAQWHEEKVVGQLTEQARLLPSFRCKGFRVPRRDGSYRVVIRCGSKQSRHQAFITYCRVAENKEVRASSLEARIATLTDSHQGLVAKWYMAEHGVKILSWHYQSFRWYIHVDWSSEEVETSVNDKLLEGRRLFQSDSKLALRLLKPPLPDNCAKLVLGFMPDYKKHLELGIRELESQLGSKMPW
ncbi:unnamed protein product [Polarella glacialis]|uniref:Uncharacterized protein n=1 Tax=Polarella glacialis TaxID=89957 RepID=A0A813GMX2_POLGL|nr:unnamed protein product [Polarella glacialis]